MKPFPKEKFLKEEKGISNIQCKMLRDLVLERKAHWNRKLQFLGG